MFTHPASPTSSITTGTATCEPTSASTARRSGIAVAARRADPKESSLDAR
jgi:hypothetical protein